MKVGSDVSNPDDLRDLPYGTVVLDERSVAWQKRWFKEPRRVHGWISAGQSDRVRTSEFLIRKAGSVRIIHLPDESPWQ